MDRPPKCRLPAIPTTHPLISKYFLVPPSILPSFPWRNLHKAPAFSSLHSVFSPMFPRVYKRHRLPMPAVWPTASRRLRRRLCKPYGAWRQVWTRSVWNGWSIRSWGVCIVGRRISKGECEAVEILSRLWHPPLEHEGNWHFLHDQITTSPDARRLRCQNLML